MIVLHVAEQVSALQFVVSSTLLEVRVLVIVCVYRVNRVGVIDFSSYEVSFIEFLCAVTVAD